MSKWHQHFFLKSSIIVIIRNNSELDSLKRWYLLVRISKFVSIEDCIQMFRNVIKKLRSFLGHSALLRSSTEPNPEVGAI